MLCDRARLCLLSALLAAVTVRTSQGSMRLAALLTFIVSVLVAGLQLKRTTGR